MKPEYGASYGRLYAEHWWWRAREAVVLSELARKMPAQRWGSILDVGCGDALFFDRLAPLGEVWGVEADRSLVTEGPHRSRVEICEFGSSYCPDRHFRLILMLDVLEHMANPVEALRHAGTLLEPGGWLLVTVPAFRMLWTAHDDFNAHFDRFTIRRLRELTRAGGFDIAEARYLFHWLFPAKLLVRATEALRPRPRKPAGIPPAWLNRLLLAASRAENRVLAGLHLPFGSSILAWCRATIPSREAAIAIEPPGPPGT